MIRSIRKWLLLDEHVCPWWFIGSFDNPLRRWIHPPEKILSGLVQTGQAVLDLGCGMGYFTIPLARMVGGYGIVLAVDLQTQMLAGVRRRAERAGMSDRIQLHLAAPEKIGVSGPVDFALAFWMVHEVRYQESFLTGIFDVLKPGGCLMVSEPRLHVRARQFDEMLLTASRIGFRASAAPPVRFSRSILLIKD